MLVLGISDTHLAIVLRVKRAPEMNSADSTKLHVLKWHLLSSDIIPQQGYHWNAFHLKELYFSVS